MPCPNCGYAGDEVEQEPITEPVEPTDEEKQSEFAAALMRQEEGI